MPQHFGSRFLTDSLNKYGFCVSYQKVLNYELCVAVQKGTKIAIVSESSSAEPTHLMHHVPDNANQNPRTLDGCNTVYGMGTMLHLLLLWVLCYICCFLIINHNANKR